MQIETSDVFVVQRRLLMNYYPGPLGGLSEMAFRKYILACRSARPYRDTLSPCIVWSGQNDMTRAAGLRRSEYAQYQQAVEELRNKHFLKHRPELEFSRRPECHELLILPDYDGEYQPYNGDLERTTDNLVALRRGYIQVPTALVEPNSQSIFHKAIHDRSIPNGVNLWALVLKLYQYNHLMIHGGVDPNMLRLEHGNLWIHPSVYEELHLGREEVAAYIDYLEGKQHLAFVPIAHTTTDIVGTTQIHYLRDVKESDLKVARLRYHPANHIDDWMDKNERRLTRGNVTVQFATW